MNIGLFGGTFDPIHIGHLILAEILVSEHGLDRILFVPSARPPHKKSHDITPFEVRADMVRKAIGDVPHLMWTDIENRIPGPSYTLKTIRRLLGQNQPDTRYTLIIGADSLAELHTWHEPDALLASCPVLVVGRPEAGMEQIRPAFKSRVRMADTPLIGISSTLIRERVARGQSIRWMVPDAVADTIREKGLYR